MTVHTSSRNPAIRSMIKTDGEEATKEYVRQYYGIPAEVTNWKDIDDAAEAEQKYRNMNNQ